MSNPSQIRKEGPIFTWTSLIDSIREFLIKVQVRWSEFRQNKYKLLTFPITVFRWILFSFPLFFMGIEGKFWYEKYIQNQVAISIQTISNEAFGLIRFGVFFTLWFIGTVWRTHESAKDKYKDRIHFALRWFYDELDLGQNTEADIRCTIWTPRNSKVDPEFFRLVQIVDYVPRFGQIIDQPNRYRRNSNRGRVRKVATNKGSLVRPIGLLGKCAIGTMKERKPVIMFEEIPENADFLEYMIEKWNHSKVEARQLTPDRRSYMCLSLMDVARTDLLGIIYLDARVSNVFTEELGDKAQEYLPRIAEVLTDKALTGR